MTMQAGVFCPVGSAGILTGVSIPTGRPQDDRHRFELGTDGPRVLVVGVDGSTTSLRAGSYAAGLARRLGAHLVVVYVSRHSGMVGMAPGGAAVMQQAEEEHVAQLRALLDQRAGELGLSATFRVEAGDPYAQL